MMLDKTEEIYIYIFLLHRSLHDGKKTKRKLFWRTTSTREGEKELVIVSIRLNTEEEDGIHWDGIDWIEVILAPLGSARVC